LEVSLAFLEFMSPTLPEAADRMADRGACRVDVVPMFLGAGGHVRKDLPMLMQAIRDKHPGIDWTLQAAIGEHPSVIEAMAQAALAATAGRPQT
jgi:sirohydrochlorin cobaltochelatase